MKRNDGSEANKMARIRKSLLSILLVVVAFACFIFMPPSKSQTVSQTIEVPPNGQRTETLVTEHPGVAKLLELIGIGSLVLAAWLWRKELGITQLGFISGTAPTISQQDAGSPQRSRDESGPPPGLDLSALSAEMGDAETRQRLEHIMQMFQRLHSVNVAHVARELGISTHTAKTYLFLLTKTGQLRADGFPRRTIYTPARSLENRILDTVKQKLSESHGVLSERRYVRVKRMYEVDSLLESEDTTFIIEAKVLRSENAVSRLDNWILQILFVAKELQTRKLACVLALACVDKVDTTVVRKQVESMTFDTGSTPIDVMVLAEAQLVE